MKAHILKLLKSNNETLSGTELARILGISRVAVWKQVQSLKDMGYPIYSGHKGHKLTDKTNDFLYSWEVPEIPSYYHFNEIESTMGEAERLAARGTPDLSLISADIQSSGKGRLGRKWNSGFGGLYCSLVLRPRASIKDSWYYGFMAALAAAEAIDAILEGTGAKESKLKWPNDVLLYDMYSGKEKKVAGILAEARSQGEKISWLAIGVGINVNNRPEIETALGLSEISGYRLSRKKVLIDFYNAFTKHYQANSSEAVRSAWKQRSSTIGRSVSIIEEESEIHGKAVDLENDGSLLLKTCSGKYKRFYYGDCFHLEHRGSESSEENHDGS
jgi:BirA family transcriptional regulator, biotin operon repressor / biotin---[acetyl-CoA-carboxylase] ligase